MGCFSWLDCKDGSQIKARTYEKVFVLIPREFGGGHIVESYYEGYGVFGGLDVFVLAAEWNTDKAKGIESEQLYFDEEVFEELREIGIDLAGEDEGNTALKYPIKITHDATAVYEDCQPSLTDDRQGL